MTWSQPCLYFADFGVEVAHYKQHVPLGDLFDCLRQVLVEPLHFFIRSCCHWSIGLHVNQNNVSWFRLESHNKECSSNFSMNPYCHSWHAVSKSTWVYYCMAIQCCEMPLSIPSHLWQPTYINPQLHLSSLSSWTFPSCSILRTFHVPSLNACISIIKIMPCSSVNSH